MANLGQTFNVADHKELSNLLPAPADYKLALTRNQVVDRQDGGKNLKLEYDVQEGQFQGRKLFDTIGFDQSDQDKAERAKARLAQLCKAVGKANIQDADELMGIPFTAHVIITKGKDQYPDQNYIAKYREKDGNNTSQAAPAQSNGAWGQ